jgi:hypothetical protein
MMIREDFIGGTSNPNAGDMGWRTIAGGTLQAKIAEADHPGIATCSVTGSGAATYGALGGLGTVASAGNGSVFASDVNYLEFIVRPITLVSDVRLFVGLSNSPDNTNQNTVDCIGAAFDTGLADAGWQLQTRSGASSSRNGSGVSVTVATWYKIVLMKTSTGWSLQVNDTGNLVINTTDIPTGRMYPTFWVSNLAAGTRGIDCDFFKMIGTGLNRF